MQGLWLFISRICRVTFSELYRASVNANGHGTSIFFRYHNFCNWTKPRHNLQLCSWRCFHFLVWTQLRISNIFQDFAGDTYGTPMLIIREIAVTKAGVLQLGESIYSHLYVPWAAFYPSRPGRLSQSCLAYGSSVWCRLLQGPLWCYFPLLRRLLWKLS